MSIMADIKAVLFDIGEVVSCEQWHLFDAIEARTGSTIVGRGPLAPDGDPVWQRYLDGELSFTGYWSEFAQANGYDDWRLLFRECVVHMDGDEFVHPAAAALISDARAAGLRIGALTNDGVGISGQSFFESVPIIAGFDAFCDAQRFGGKPAPAAYLNAASELGVHPGEVIFLDDMTYCVDGARAVGMQAVLVDPMERHVAFDEARGLAGIGSPDPAREAVVSAEAAYLSQDLDRIMALFDPDISIHWNGERVALGLDEARRFHIDHLGFGAGERVGFDLRKRLRASSGDTVAVEYESSYTRSDGSTVRSRASELWTMRRGLLVEWHCYQQRLGE